MNRTHRYHHHNLAFFCLILCLILNAVLMMSTTCTNPDQEDVLIFLSLFELSLLHCVNTSLSLQINYTMIAYL